MKFYKRLLNSPNKHFTPDDAVKEAEKIVNRYMGYSHKRKKLSKESIFILAGSTLLFFAISIFTVIKFLI